MALLVPFTEDHSYDNLAYGNFLRQNEPLFVLATNQMVKLRVDFQTSTDLSFRVITRGAIKSVVTVKRDENRDLLLVFAVTKSKHILYALEFIPSGTVSFHLRKLLAIMRDFNNWDQMFAKYDVHYYIPQKSMVFAGILLGIPAIVTFNSKLEAVTYSLAINPTKDDADDMVLQFVGIDTLAYKLSAQSPTMILKLFDDGWAEVNSVPPKYEIIGPSAHPDTMLIGYGRRTPFTDNPSCCCISAEDIRGEKVVRGEKFKSIESTADYAIYGYNLRIAARYVVCGINETKTMIPAKCGHYSKPQLKFLAISNCERFTKPVYAIEDHGADIFGDDEIRFFSFKTQVRIGEYAFINDDGLCINIECNNGTNEFDTMLLPWFKNISYLHARNSFGNKFYNDTNKYSSKTCYTIEKVLKVPYDQPVENFWILDECKLICSTLARSYFIDYRTGEVREKHYWYKLNQRTLLATSQLQVTTTSVRFREGKTIKFKKDEELTCAHIDGELLFLGSGDNQIIISIPYNCVVESILDPHITHIIQHQFSITWCLHSLTTKFEVHTGQELITVEMNNTILYVVEVANRYFTLMANGEVVEPLRSLIPLPLGKVSSLKPLTTHLLVLDDENEWLIYDIVSGEQEKLGIYRCSNVRFVHNFDQCITLFNGTLELRSKGAYAEHFIHKSNKFDLPWQNPVESQTSSYKYIIKPLNSGLGLFWCRNPELCVPLIPTVFPNDMGNSWTILSDDYLLGTNRNTESSTFELFKINHLDQLSIIFLYAFKIDSHGCDVNLVKVNPHCFKFECGNYWMCLTIGPDLVIHQEAGKILLDNNVALENQNITDIVYQPNLPTYSQANSIAKVANSDTIKPIVKFLRPTPFSPYKLELQSPNQEKQVLNLPINEGLIYPFDSEYLNLSGEISRYTKYMVPTLCASNYRECHNSLNKSPIKHFAISPITNLAFYNSLRNAYLELNELLEIEESVSDCIDGATLLLGLQYNYLHIFFQNYIDPQQLLYAIEYIRK